MENTGPWFATPILISGASAYRNGEFLYQDFLYDDSGANNSATGQGFGSYTYPTNTALYAGNAADLVEVRTKLLTDGVAFRLSFNTMIDPNTVASTITLGDTAGVRALPYGANVRAPAQIFVTIRGATGDIIDAASGNPITTVRPNVVVDTARRQVHVCVPYAAYDPRPSGTMRLSVGTGLWDAANNRYLLPQATANATTPGGRGSFANPPGFFNVAFRYAEPISGSTASVGAAPTRQQATTLATGDISSLAVSVDVNALAQGANDDMIGRPGGVPQTGYMNRILVSHFEQAQGRGNATTLQPDRCPTTGCPPPQYAGRLQNYEIYVPTGPMPPDGYGLWLQPHAAGGNQNNYPAIASQWQIQAGESANRYLLFTPNARGTAYWYYGQAGAEVFEIWADIAHYYKVDTRNQVIGALSMGGYAAWKLGAQFPDLFAVAPMIVPCPSAGTGMTSLANVPGGSATLLSLLSASFRNVPQYIWTGNRDTTCTYIWEAAYIKTLHGTGNRYQWYTFPLMGHGYPLGNEFTPMVQWVNAQQKRVVNPPSISYVLNDEMNEPSVGLNADHVYWVSGLAMRNTSVMPPIGKIDVRSRGFGLGNPPVLPPRFENGQMQGQTGPVTYSMQAQEWGVPPTAPVENVIDITASNVSQMTINPARANVDCNVRLNVNTDGPLLVSFYNCTRAPEQY